MDEEIYALHIAAGHAAGRDRTCGTKQRHTDEEAATKAAASLNNSGKARHEVEAYPCYWCGAWHIGRKMSIEELQLFAAQETNGG